MTATVRRIAAAPGEEQETVTIQRPLSACVLLTAAAWGCGDATAPNDVAIGDVVGTWDATSLIFEESGGVRSADLIASGGAFSLEITQEERYTATLTVPGEDSPDVARGIIRVGFGIITAAADRDPFNPVTYLIQSFDGDAMTLIDPEEEFDFDTPPDGSDEPATLTLVLRKRSRL